MANFSASPKWKRFTNFMYGIGAAVVIIGALCKINHWEILGLGADIILAIGLGTEALIFAISAFEAPHKEYDWSLAYPELIGLEENERKPKAARPSLGGLGALDELFSNANLDKDIFEKLGKGISDLENTASELNSIGNASLATNKYVNSMETAAKSVDQLASVYEIQLKSTNEHFDASQKVQHKMNDMMNNLTDTLNNSKEFKEQTDKLTQNLTALNEVYGNMLSAMNVNK